MTRCCWARKACSRCRVTVAEGEKEEEIDEEESELGRGVSESVGRFDLALAGSDRAGH